MEKTYEQVSLDVKKALISCGYKGIIGVEVHEHSEGDALDIIVERDVLYAQSDPMDLIIDSIQDVNADQQLDELKVLQATYGEQVIDFSCNEQTLIIELKEAA